MHPTRFSAISVAMATYNGARNLPEQLRSLTGQTQLPAELVVCDDQSSDATLDVLAEFAQAAPFPVQVHRNTRRLGPANNFFRAAGLCRNDHVAFCDQDDIWRPAKLALCQAAIVRSSPDIVLHRYTSFCIDEHGRSQVDPFRSKMPNKILLGSDIHPEYMWHGMSMVVRRSMIADAAALAKRWQSYCEAFTAPDERLGSYDWANSHDLAVLVAVRESGTMVLLNRYLAEHRTMDGGLFSDPRGQENAFASLLPIAPFTDDSDRYRRLALFCARMAEFVEKIGNRPATQTHYRRWENLARFRSIVRDPAKSQRDRIDAAVRLASLKAYRNKWSGGEGHYQIRRDIGALARRSTPTAGTQPLTA